MDPIVNFDLLKQLVTDFISSTETQSELMISSKLRRPLRDFKQLFPDIYYFAYGLGSTYKLVVSKSKFHIDFNDLSPKVRKTFVDYNFLKIEPNITSQIIEILDPYLNLSNHLDKLMDALRYCGAEREFINKHHDIQKKIYLQLKQSPNYSNWIKLQVKKSPLFISIMIYSPKINQINLIMHFIIQ